MSRSWQEIATDCIEMCSIENAVEDDDEFCDRIVELFVEAADLPADDQTQFCVVVITNCAATQEQILRDRPDLALKLQLARQLDLGGNN